MRASWGRKQHLWRCICLVFPMSRVLQAFVATRPTLVSPNPPQELFVIFIVVQTANGKFYYFHFWFYRTLGFFVFLFNYVCGCLPVSHRVHVVSIMQYLKRPEEGIRSMELALETVVSLYMGAGNQTRVF